MTNLGLNFTSAISLLYKAFKTLIYLQVESNKTIYLKQVKKENETYFYVINIFKLRYYTS